MKDIVSESLAHITNGVVITDPNTKDNPIIYVNKGFTTITGYEEKDVIGKNCRFLQGKETNQEELNKIRLAVQKNKPTNVVLKNYKKNGRTFWNELYISPIKYKGKTYFIGIQQDVTARIQAEDELEIYKQKLERLVEERTKKILEANKKLMQEIEENKQAQKKIILLNDKLMIYGKRLEQKLLAKKEHISSKEKKVLVALQESPRSKLQELHKKTKLPLSTISTIKKRLMHKVIDRVEIPHPTLFNLLTLVIYRNQELKTFPEEAFFGAKTKQNGFYMMLNKDWMNFNKTQQQSSIQPSEVVHFDTTTAHIDILGVTNDKKKKLKQTQIKTAYGITKYIATKEAAKRTNSSIQTITKHLKELRKENILNTIYHQKLNKTKHIILLKKKTTDITIQDNKKLFGIMFSKEWDEIETEAELIIPTNEAEIKMDFSGAIKKNYLVQK
jgi:PAS domain S-box-containing protein